jgi:hypothetical protein
VKDFTPRFTLKLEASAAILAIIAFIYRWRSDTYPISRLCLCLALLPYFMHIFKFYVKYRFLGTKVMMIRRMVKRRFCINTCILQGNELAMFILIVIVVLAAYSIASTVLMRGEIDEFYWGIFWELYKFAVWDIFGEINKDAVNGEVNCDTKTCKFIF